MLGDPTSKCLKSGTINYEMGDGSTLGRCGERIDEYLNMSV